MSSYSANESFYATNAGNYTVVVSNSAGSVTSQVATLTLNFPMKLSVQAKGNQIILSWSEAAMTLEESADVTGPWTSVVGGSASPRSVPISANRKFYRLRK